MARLIETSLIAWELTRRELQEGSVLNQYQKYLIQTDLAAICEQILGLTYDTKNPLEHIAKHAELTGQKQALQTLLDRSEIVQEELKQEVSNSPKN